MSNNKLYETLVNSKFDELETMIKEYNSINCDNFKKKYEYFLKCLSYVIQLEEDGMLVKCKNETYNISYLETILDNDGPEYALIIGFSNPYKNKVMYEIGVCVRGTPLLKKIKIKRKNLIYRIVKAPTDD